MISVFQIVYQFLLWLSARTGLTYEEVNIIVYYFLVPLAFLVLLDRIFRTWICTVGFLSFSAAGLLIISNFEQFSKSLFGLSVSFLQQFSRIGWTYTEASVWICVVSPGIAFLLLCYLASRRRAAQHQQQSTQSET